MSETSLTGGCLCGGVRYEITEPLLKMTYCHCTRCQRRTGAAASPQGRIVPGSLRILQGEELVKEWKPERGFGKCFCSACGGGLWSRSPEGEIASVRLGTFDSDPGIRPSYRAFTAYAVPWEPIPEDGTLRYPEAAV
jgi:hypothetical protein